MPAQLRHLLQVPVKLVVMGFIAIFHSLGIIDVGCAQLVAWEKFFVIRLIGVQFLLEADTKVGFE